MTLPSVILTNILMQMLWSKRLPPLPLQVSDNRFRQAVRLGAAGHQSAVKRTQNLRRRADGSADNRQTA